MKHFNAHAHCAHCAKEEKFEVRMANRFTRFTVCRPNEYNVSNRMKKTTTKNQKKTETNFERLSNSLCPIPEPQIGFE